MKALFNLVAVTLTVILFSRSAQAQSIIQVQKLRIIKQYINHIVLQCPVNSNLVRSEHIKWINERYDFTKPDDQVLISSQNLLANGQLNFQLQDGLTYLSCGYILNNCYVRVKLWQIDYVCKFDIFKWVAIFF